MLDHTLEALAKSLYDAHLAWLRRPGVITTSVVRPEWVGLNTSEKQYYLFAARYVREHNVLPWEVLLQHMQVQGWSVERNHYVTVSTGAISNGEGRFLVSDEQSLSDANLFYERRRILHPLEPIDDRAELVEDVSPTTSVYAHLHLRTPEHLYYGTVSGIVWVVATDRAYVKEKALFHERLLTTSGSDAGQ